MNFVLYVYWCAFIGFSMNRKVIQADPAASNTIWILQFEIRDSIARANASMANAINKAYS